MKRLETDNTAIFDGITTDFGKIIVWKNVTSIVKPLVEFSSYISYLMIASYNGWKIHNVILCKYYVSMSLCKYYVTMEVHFYKQRILSTKPQFCLTFLWIEPKMLLKDCLLHIDMILPRHIIFCLFVSMSASKLFR